MQVGYEIVSYFSALAVSILSNYSPSFLADRTT